MQKELRFKKVFSMPGEKSLMPKCNPSKFLVVSQLQDRAMVNAKA